MEFITRQILVGPCRGDLGEGLVLIERIGARQAQNMLGEYIQPTGERRFAVLGALGHRLKRCLAFEHFEAVGGNEHGLGGLVEPMVGAPDSLEHA